jgi:hypothetical protein
VWNWAETSNTTNCETEEDSVWLTRHQMQGQCRTDGGHSVPIMTSSIKRAPPMTEYGVLARDLIKHGLQLQLCRLPSFADHASLHRPCWRDGSHNSPSHTTLPFPVPLPPSPSPSRLPLFFPNPPTPSTSCISTRGYLVFPAVCATCLLPS